MQVNRGQRPCIEPATLNDAALINLAKTRWRHLFRPNNTISPINAVSGYNRLCASVSDMIKLQAENKPMPELFRILDSIPLNAAQGTVGVRSVMLSRLWQSMRMHVRVHRVQTELKRRQSHQKLISDKFPNSNNDAAQGAAERRKTANERAKWERLKTQPATTILPELDLAYRALLPHYYASDLVTHDGLKEDGCSDDWGRIHTHPMFIKAHDEIGRSFYTSGFSHASQSIIRSVERFLEFGMLHILPVKAEVGLVLETRGSNENKMMRNAFSHNNYGSALDPTIVGDYRIYMWNMNDEEDITFGAVASFPELTEYELRLRVILTLLVTGVLYDEKEIEEVRKKAPQQSDAETSAEKDARKREENAVNKRKNTAEKKAKLALEAKEKEEKGEAKGKKDVAGSDSEDDFGFGGLE